VPGFDRMWAEGHGEGPLRDLRFLAANRPEWQRYLAG
jgi:hypothetical protein